MNFGRKERERLAGEASRVCEGRAGGAPEAEPSSAAAIRATSIEMIDRLTEALERKNAEARRLLHGE